MTDHMFEWPTKPNRPRHPTRRARGVSKQAEAEIRSFELSKKSIVGKRWPTVYVIPQCRCSRWPFSHTHPSMKWKYVADDDNDDKEKA
jgi:hypothetical protein